MPKKLVYVFGPDGAGKSTLVKDLAHDVPDSVIVGGSCPALWPDTSWHEETAAAGIDPWTKDPSYHLATLNRCFAMIGSLLRPECPPPVVVDSDPRAQIAVKACTLYAHPTPLPEFYAQLDEMAAPHLEGVQQVGVYVTVGQGSPEARAEALAARIEGRGGRSAFEPASLEQARDLVLAFDSLEGVLQDRNVNLVRVETDAPFDPCPLRARVLTA
jgi:hypothetical protein